MAKKKKPKVADVSLDLIIEPKFMIRMNIDQDYIRELAQSISEVGLLQPILLAIEGGEFEIVAGHCRYLAHKHIGLSEIKAVIREMSTEERGVARATENIQRIDLTPIEEAATYKDLMEAYGLTIEKVAKKIGRTAVTIKRRMDLLRMPPALQQAIHKKQISMTVGEELWPIADLTSLEYYLAFAIENGCTKVVARQWAKDWKDQERRSGGSGDEGGGIATSVFEPRPSYVPCDICNEPVKLEESKFIRTCQVCMGAIKKGMEVKK